MSEGQRLEDSWTKFLNRNNLICQKSCCYEVRKMAQKENVDRFEASDDEAKQMARAHIQRLLDLEAQGMRFKWAGNELTTIKEMVSNE